MTRRAVKRSPPEPPSVVSFETFRDIRGYEARRLEQDEPSCFNGMVRVRKFRITIELIEEPDEVVGERIQALWETSDNYHHRDPLRNCAAKYGFALCGDPGAKRAKR